MIHIVRIPCDVRTDDGSERREDFILLHVEADNRSDAVTAVSDMLTLLMQPSTDAKGKL